jgi:hypothetical protein
MQTDVPEPGPGEVRLQVYRQPQPKPTSAFEADDRRRRSSTTSPHRSSPEMDAAGVVDKLGPAPTGV